jgi:hypothetical protein
MNLYDLLDDLIEGSVERIFGVRYTVNFETQQYSVSYGGETITKTKGNYDIN